MQSWNMHYGGTKVLVYRGVMFNRFVFRRRKTKFA